MDAAGGQAQFASAQRQGSLRGLREQLRVEPDQVEWEKKWSRGKIGNSLDKNLRKSSKMRKIPEMANVQSAPEMSGKSASVIELVVKARVHILIMVKRQFSRAPPPSFFSLCQAPPLLSLSPSLSHTPELCHPVSRACLQSGPVSPSRCSESWSRCLLVTRPLGMVKTTLVARVFEALNRPAPHHSRLLHPYASSQKG